MSVRVVGWTLLTLAFLILSTKSGVRAAEVQSSAVIKMESSRHSVAVNTESGLASVIDLSTGESMSVGDGGVLGRFVFRGDGQAHTLTVGDPSGSRVGFESWDVYTQDGVTTLALTLSVDTSQGPLGIIATYRLGETPDQLEVSVETHPNSGMALEAATIHFAPGPWSDLDQGYMVVPQRQGALIPASDLLAPTVISVYHQGGLSMPFFGWVNGPVAWMVAFDASEGAIRVSNSPRGGKIQLTVENGPYTFDVTALPGGSYVEMAQVYRQRAIDNGLFVSLEEKVQRNPDVAKIVGAVDLKFFFEGGSFDEPVEGLRRLQDMGVDNAFVIYAGWMMHGYDFLHPDVVTYDVNWIDGAWRDRFGHIIRDDAVTVADNDREGQVILPAQPGAGGDLGLKAAATDIRDLGYVFGLHDNYQDIYADAPSFHPDVVLRDGDGEPRKGGVWAGGQAYLLHPAHALSFAQRNIEWLVDQLPINAIFVDTTTATPFYRDDHPESRLTRSGDMRLRQELLSYLQQAVGVVGSEAGGAWAIPYTDYFEGMAGSDIGITIPLFDLVFHDAVLRQRHQGDGDLPGQPEKLLDALRSGRASNFSIWNRISDRPVFSGRLLEGWPMSMPDYIRMAALMTGTLNELTGFHPMKSHKFLTSDRSVERSVFSSDLGVVTVVVNRSEQAYAVSDTVLPPFGFLIEAPAFVAAYVTRYNGEDLPRPTLFALKALDGKPLDESEEILVYQGDAEDPTTVPFGDGLIEVGYEVVIRR